MDNKISIVIPSFNRLSDLTRCLEQLNEQSCVLFEVVVVDDCSDIPVVINDEYNYELVVYRSDVNLGAAGARNKGVELATGLWILFLDDDDCFVYNKVEVIRDIISINPEVNFISHRALVHMVNEGVSYVTSVSGASDLSFDDLIRSNYIGGAPVFAVKKNIFLSVGGFDRSLAAIEDYEFILRLSLFESVNSYFLDGVFTECFYITRRTSVSKNIVSLEQAISILETRYVTVLNKKSFQLNCDIMRSHCHLMNLERRCSKFYFKAYLSTKDFKYFIASFVSILSPTALIYLRSKVGK